MLQIKKWGHCIILIAIAVELILWPSLENLIGCGMTLICWIIFSKIGLNETTIKEHIFSWLVFLSMSLYRILPLLATLLECHSIGYNFVNPIETYLGETCLFLISALAFYLATNQKKALISLKIRLYKCGFYDRVSDNTIWCLGILGLIIRFYLMSTHIQIGDIIGKALSGFTFFQYAPIMLFFPSLYKMSKLKKIIVFNKGGVIYFIFIILLSFATNSRYAILEPFGTFALLFLLSYIQHPSRLRQNINKKYTILIDPGHGGNDKGTIANDKITFEKDITLKVGALVAQKLTKQKDVQVIISRNEDKYVSLADRAKLANEQGVDALVSIHLNGQTGGTDAFGLETYYTKEKNDGSYELAKQIQETITSYIDVRDRGVKPERFQVLLQSKMPAVLIECGFLSNDEEAKKLKDEAYQESLAEGIAQGILTYLDTNSKK